MYASILSASEYGALAGDRVTGTAAEELGAATRGTVPPGRALGSGFERLAPTGQRRPMAGEHTLAAGSTLRLDVSPISAYSAPRSHIASRSWRL